MPLPLTPPATDALHFASAQFAPSLYTRAHFDAHYPALAALQADLQGMDSDTGHVPQAMCAMTQCRNFAPLIGELGSTMPVLVFFLPQVFERFLPQLAMTEILVHNWTALDLSKNMTYCSWYVHENQVEIGWCTGTDLLQICARWAAQWRSQESAVRRNPANLPVSG